MRTTFRLVATGLLAFLAFLAFALAACKQPATPKEEASGGMRARSFAKPVPPAVCTDEAARQEYTVLHWWDGFDFGDSAWITGTDSVVLEQAFADYLGVLQTVGTATQEESVKILLQTAERGTAPVFGHFMHLAEHYLYEAGSPLRNDALYLAAAGCLLASPAVDETTKSRLESQARMLRKNQPGMAAADFSYTTIGGIRSRLHSLKAEYTLLFFYDPDCDVCTGVRTRLVASPAVQRLTANGRLKILAVYPDADTQSWLHHAAEMPEDWITARDESGRITTGGLYDLRGLPSLYLLDGRKRVVLKDASPQRVVNELERITNYNK